MADRTNKSPKRQSYEIESIDADGNRQRAPVFQAVIKVLEGVPPASERSEKRSDEIEQLAFTICLAAGFAGMNDQPNAHQHPGGTDGDLKELQRAHDLLFDLADHLFRMHRDSRLALEKHDAKGLREFQRDVGQWSNRATEAWSVMNDGGHRAPRGGQPRSDVRAAVRPVALQAFARLTDRPVARKSANYGPLTDFFESLYLALGFSAKGARRQARQALEERDAALAETPL